MTAQTITEKILARAAGVDAVEPGEIVMCDVDLAMGNDITAPVAIARFRELGVSRVWDPSKVALVPSHFLQGGHQAVAGEAGILQQPAGSPRVLDQGEQRNQPSPHRFSPNLHGGPA